MTTTFKYSVLPLLASPLASGAILSGIDMLMGKSSVQQSLVDGLLLATANLGSNFASNILYKGIDYIMPDMPDMDYMRNWIVTPLISAWIYDSLYNSTVPSDFGLNFDSLRGKWQNYLYGYAASVSGQMLADPVLNWLM
jgi:hypothetical protein